MMISDNLKQSCAEVKQVDQQLSRGSDTTFKLMVINTVESSNKSGEMTVLKMLTLKEKQS